MPISPFDDALRQFNENKGDAAADSSTQYGFSETSFGHFTGFEAFSGTIGTAGDEDWVKLVPLLNHQYCLTVEGTGTTPLADPEILLYDSTGNLVATEPLAGTSHVATKFFALKGLDDVFYVSVRSASGTGAGDYTFAVQGVGGYFEGHLVNRDFLEGTPNADIIFSFGGPDEILAGTGDDTIFGGAGNDDIGAGGGDDLVYGGAGDDSLFGGGGNDTLLGGAGNDLIHANEEDDLVRARDGNDLVRGSKGNDFILGGNGNDTLIGGTGNDTLIGGSGAILARIWLTIPGPPARSPLFWATTR